MTEWFHFVFTFHFHALEKEMATNSSVLAWRIPGMGEPGGLPSMGLHRVGQNWSDLAEAYRVRFVLSFCLFVCGLFVFPLMNKAQWGSNPVCWWLGLNFCFICCLMRHHSQSATGGWVMLNLVFKWFPLCEFYLKFPWKKSCDQPRQHIPKQRHYFAH